MYLATDPDSYNDAQKTDVRVEENVTLNSITKTLKSFDYQLKSMCDLVTQYK